MAEQLFSEFKPVIGQKCILEKAVLIPGGGGVFDVRLDGDLVFSKHETGRFPNLAEIAEAVRARAK
ncbi:MAG: Rdx family protein [Armatimonadetes bacterium]|nr:Rdx family protein [Armatimonadota bacterium]MCA1997841.1 Rdx family protein [Armatimonadota bacterium]